LTRSRTPLLIAIVIAVVAVAAIAAVVLSRGDDDGEAGGAPAATGAPGSGDEAYGTVSVEGDALPPGEGSDDPAAGSEVPAISGTDYAGTPTAVTPGDDGPLMIVVMAHWCPHCNREVPLLLDWKASGDVPEDLRVVGVSTAADDERPNYPPAEWLQGLGWDWPVIADDQEQTAAVALGTTGYPYLVFVDASGAVVARVSGELPIEAVQQLADLTVAAS
jgi:cytochrome c biogenesis protein CcmG/thiol:disulfide interchange protein DsbE